MKRPIIAALALLTFALPVAAQQRMGGPPQSGAGIFTGITLTARAAEAGRLALCVEPAHARQDAGTDGVRTAP